MKICIVTGARPNFIKVAPLVHAIEQRQAQGEPLSYHLVYAGTDCDNTLEQSLFSDLQLKRPDVFLGVTSTNVNEITAEVMSKFEQWLHQNPADVVIVVDDLASTMAAAIVTKKQGIKLAHLVAGTRSFDISMPKEINRLVIDGLSDFLFTAGMSQGTTADQSKIFDVGNILMDTLRTNISRFRRPDVLDGVEDGEYAVLTVNRKALLDNPEKLSTLLAPLSKYSSLPVFAVMRNSVVIPASNIRYVEPMGYLEFGYLTQHAKVIITDSGNVAEEATFNGVPCITLNNYTEHAETVRQGTNILVNEDPQLLSEALQNVLSGNLPPHSIPERWDGRTAERILKIIA